MALWMFYITLNISVQSKRTKKVGITGKYGTRYGASLRKIIKKMEVSQHSKYFCPFCGKVCLVRSACCLVSHRARPRPAWDPARALWTGSAYTHARRRFTMVPGMSTWNFLGHSLELEPYDWVAICSLAEGGGSDCQVQRRDGLMQSCIEAMTCSNDREMVQTAMKRQAAGIWKCRGCTKTMAGGAYVLTCVLCSLACPRSRRMCSVFLCSLCFHCSAPVQITCHPCICQGPGPVWHIGNCSAHTAPLGTWMFVYGSCVMQVRPSLSCNIQRQAHHPSVSCAPCVGPPLFGED
jgi:large subunit ribosomal protein L37Ae